MLLQRLSISVLLATAIACPCLADETTLTFPDLFGRWKVRRELESAPITAGEVEERKPLGKTFTISADAIITPWRQPPCVPRHIKMEFVDTKAELEENWRVTMSGLGLAKGSLKPRMQLMDAGCAIALIVNRDVLVWSGGSGFNYLATRLR